MVHGGVQLVPPDTVTELRGGLIHGHQVLVTQVPVGAAGDVAGLKVRHQVTLALHEATLICRQTSIRSLRYQLIGQRIQHFLHSYNKNISVLATNIFVRQISLTRETRCSRRRFTCSIEFVVRTMSQTKASNSLGHGRLHDVTNYSE